MTRRTKIIAAASAVVLASTGIGIGLAVSASGCQPDPAKAIAALPAGATWTGSGCYTTEGISVTKSVTINGGTFEDPDALGNKSAPFNPIIKIESASNVTVENVTLSGANTKGGYHGDPYVGEEGIKVIASSHVTLDNVTTSNTFGDGLIFAFAPRKPPSTNAVVTGYTVNQAGRQGATFAYVYGATITGLRVTVAADTGVDFESDLTSGQGSANVTFDNASITHSVWFNQLSGPVTFNDSTVTGKIVDRGTAAASGYPITFTGGSFTTNRAIHGRPPSGIWIDGPGNVTLTNVPIGRQTGKVAVTGLPWVVTNGGHLTLDHSPLTPPTPVGTNDSTSTVTIVPA